jgi:fructose-1,6-bisphosphatase/inositol monophosphatase family enzyme
MSFSHPHKAADNSDNLELFFDSFLQDLYSVLPSIISRRLPMKIKDDNSYVTESDIRIDDIIFSNVKDFFTTFTFFSEERQTDLNALASDDKLCFIVDPIDGTENFSSGLPEWGVSISAYKNHKHVSSLIGCPELNLWIKSGDKISRYSSRIRGLSSSLSKSDLIRATQGYEYRITGCCVYNMLNVIRGSFHSFENPKGAHSWDILAGLNLALEHGLTVNVEGGAYAGEYLAPDRKYRFKIENQ